jgi:V8-like Glu-specific endopeptidase
MERIGVSGQFTGLARRAAVIAVAVLVAILASGEAVSAQEPDIGKTEQGLSVGTLVQPGELDAVGRIPGCTATLITQDLVLTAAHCVCPASSLDGCATRTTFTLDSVFTVADPNTRQAVSIGGDVRVHPEFGMRGWQREDLAVVDLDQPASDLAAGVDPIPVEEPQDTPLAGDVLTLVGYGVSGTGCQQPSPGKQKLSLKVKASSWGGILFQYDGQHVCPGDSGGPVLNDAGHVVGVASWGNFSSDSTYRPTSYGYNWIFDLPQPTWSSCAWVPVEQAGINSHQPGPDWIPDGSFLVSLELDGNRDYSGGDTPVIGQVQYCTLDGASWGSSTWVKVGAKSHKARPAWCPDGSYLTQVDLDGFPGADELDSPVVGQARCATIAGGDYGQWGSSYWKGVESEGINSHQPGEPWCLDGAFLTQYDLDRDDSLDPHDSPVVGRAKCSMPRP